MEDYKGVETGLEEEGDRQTSCLWAYLVDLAHSYNFLSARQSPARPAQESGLELSPIYVFKHAASTGCVLIKVIAVVVAASTVQEAQFQGLAGFPP